MKIHINYRNALLYIMMFVLIILGEGLKLRSYALYLTCGCLIVSNLLLLHKNEWKLFICPELICLVLFLLYSGMTIFWAMNTGNVAYRFKILTFLIIPVILLTYEFKLKYTFRVLIPAYFVMGVLLSLLCIIYFGVPGIIQLIVGGIRLGEDEALFMGINANVIANDCAIAGIIGVYYALFHKKRIYLVSLLPTFLIVVATGSRKGIVTFLLGILLLFYFVQKYRGVRIFTATIKMILVIIVAILIVRAVLEVPGLEKVKEQYMGLINYILGNEENIDISTRTRDRMVTIGWEQFLKTPIKGIGLDNGKVINLMYNNFSAYLHNNYIELLVDGGIIGFCLYYFPLISLLLKHMRKLCENNPLVFLSMTLIVLRLITDWGRVSYFDYMNIPMFAFWIAVAYGFGDDHTEYEEVL